MYIYSICRWSSMKRVCGLNGLVIVRTLRGANSSSLAHSQTTKLSAKRNTSKTNFSILIPLGAEGLTGSPVARSMVGIFFLATWCTNFFSCSSTTRLRKDRVKKWMQRLAAEKVRVPSALRASATREVISEYSTTWYFPSTLQVIPTDSLGEDLDTVLLAHSAP